MKFVFNQPLERNLKITVSLLSVLLILAFACQKEKRFFKIGLAINLSGSGGNSGEYIRDGVKLAVENINRRGGIKGRHIDLLIRDDKNSKKGILNADRDLIAKGARIIIGHSTSQNTLIAYPLLMRENILTLSAFVQTNHLSGKDDFFIRSSVDSYANGRAMNNLLVRRGIQSIALLLDNSNAGFVQDYAFSIGQEFKGRINQITFNNRKKFNYNKIAASLAVVKPQAIILLTEVSSAGIISQHLRRLGYRGDLISSTWAQTPELFLFGGKAVEGLTILSFINPQHVSKAYSEFKKAYVERFEREPSARSARAFELVTILAQAVAKAKNFRNEEIKRNLIGKKFETMFGILKFDKNGDVIRPFYEIRIRSGRFVTEGGVE